MLVTELFCVSNLGLPSWLRQKEFACNAGNSGSIPGQEDSLEKGGTNYSSILAWRIPWIEEAGELYSSWGCKESDTTE